MTPVTQDLRDALREKVQAEMDDLRIEDFKVTADHDHDGDPILRVEIVYDDTAGAPQTARMTALTRRVRPLLQDEQFDAFPIFRFVAARDLVDDAR